VDSDCPCPRTVRGLGQSTAAHWQRPRIVRSQSTVSNYPWTVRELEQFTAKARPPTGHVLPLAHQYPQPGSIMSTRLAMSFPNHPIGESGVTCRDQRTLLASSIFELPHERRTSVYGSAAALRSGKQLFRASREGWSFWTLLSWLRCHPMTWSRSSPSI
jgi:hypothetical protein